MTEAKHTTGPWFVGGFIHDEEDPESYPEWVVQRSTPAGDLSIAVAVHVQNPEMHEANARLIAAAPELLEALQRMLNDNSYYFPAGNSWGDRARAAIAKAIGSA